jgi:hypothetical protein
MTARPDRLAIVRDHELLALIEALDEAHETINRVGKALKRASDYLREQRERQQR